MTAKISDEALLALNGLVLKYEREDQSVRQQQLRMWKKNDNFWHGLQHIFWSERHQDWINPTDPNYNNELEDTDVVYDNVINIYKAHGESVVAALSVDVPGVIFPPDDADNSDDLITSKTFAKVSTVIQRHNKGKLLLMQSLHIAWTQGLVAGYISSRESVDYGTVKVPNFTQQTILVCQQCGIESEGEVCPECGGPTMAQKQQVQTGETESPKRRAIIEVFGPLNVKVPYKATRQKEFGYIQCIQDLPKEFVMSLFEEDVKLDDTEDEEKETRMPSGFGETYGDSESMAFKRTWLRPWTFRGLKDDVRKELIAAYPKGCCVYSVGQSSYEVYDENMDDRWVVGKVGLSRFIHSDPLGQSLISPQEMTNNLVNLTEDTIEHSIPSTFADPKVIDFKEYGRTSVRPGDMFPAKPIPGKSLGESFYESGRANLSREVAMFSDYLEKSAQFVTGSFPSIYGGPSEGSSRTFGEYAQSRDQARQRLSIANTYISFWWADLMHCGVKLFLENMVSDEEKFVEKKDGGYINVWIKKSEARGKVGDVEPESSDTIPTSLAQRQTQLSELMKMNSDFINAALFDVENRKVLADAFNFTELVIPGEAQRLKQCRENKLMMGGEQVMIDEVLDDHEVHFQVVQNFLIGEEGASLKDTQPELYQSIYQHAMMHKQAMEMQAAQEATAGQEEEKQPDAANS